MEDLDFEKPVALSMEKICDEWCISGLSDLFEAIDKTDVLACLPGNKPSEDSDDIEKIAWYFYNDSDGAITIDLGCPTFRDTPFDITKGLHIFAAALIKNQPYINAHASGEVDWIDNFLWPHKV